MKTIKKGSIGDEVKVLQKYLGINVDGIFGPVTEKKVKEWQKENGLTPDGIVGPKSWAIVQKHNTVSSESKINIIDAHINTHITYSRNRPIKYIAVHYTAGATSKKGTARNTRNVFLKRKASADFVVDDEEIVRINPDIRNYFCWSVGDTKNKYSSGGRLYGKATNKNTISIEICSNLKKDASASVANHEGWYYTQEALNNTLQLIRYLMKTYNVPKSNVVRHYDISGKLCPGIIGWNNEPIYTIDGKTTKEKSNSKKWEEFYAQI